MNLSFLNHVDEILNLDYDISFVQSFKQDLKGTDFDEDSDDEYVPVDDELLLLEDESCLKKRKRKDTKTATSKKVKTDFDCNMCGKSFSRKDSLTRHRKNYCK